MLIIPQKCDDKSFKLQTNENKIIKVLSAKYLGMTMESNLKWSLQINGIIIKYSPLCE